MEIDYFSPPLGNTHWYGDALRPSKGLWKYCNFTQLSIKGFFVFVVWEYILRFWRHRGLSCKFYTYQIDFVDRRYSICFLCLVFKELMSKSFTITSVELFVYYNKDIFKTRLNYNAKFSCMSKFDTFASLIARKELQVMSRNMLNYSFIVFSFTVLKMKMEFYAH